MVQPLPREVLKWLQALDLTHSVKNIRRDFSNGYLIAEIFSWYRPQEIQMHSFDNGTSIETKLSNWSILQRFFQREEIEIPKEEVEATIHCKPGAASRLIQRIYTILTKTSILGVESVVDFSDNNYQQHLPLHARSTTTQAINNNIANSEFYTDPDIILCGKKAEAIIKVHINNRLQQRKEDPERFGIKPTLCERSPRVQVDVSPEEYYNTVNQSKKLNASTLLQDIEIGESVTEIKVKQHGLAKPKE